MQAITEMVEMLDEAVVHTRSVMEVRRQRGVHVVIGANAHGDGGQTLGWQFSFYLNSCTRCQYVSHFIPPTHSTHGN